MMFPLWFLELIVVGGLTLCGVGAAALIVFWILDFKEKRIG